MGICILVQQESFFFLRNVCDELLQLVLNIPSLCSNLRTFLYRKLRFDTEQIPRDKWMEWMDGMNK